MIWALLVLFGVALVRAQTAAPECGLATAATCTPLGRDSCLAGSPNLCGACFALLNGVSAPSNEQCESPIRATIESDSAENLLIKVQQNKSVVVHVGDATFDVAALFTALQTTIAALQTQNAVLAGRVAALEATGAQQRLTNLEASRQAADAAFALFQSAAQLRVTGSCALGTNVRAVNADGTVVCQQDKDTVFVPDYNVLQKRVVGVCPAGQSVASVTVNGTVTCYTDKDTIFSPDFTILQRRVGAACAASGQAIQTVNADGTVICMPPYVPTFTVVQKRIAAQCNNFNFMIGVQEDGTPICASTAVSKFIDASGVGWTVPTTLDVANVGMIHGPFDVATPSVQRVVSGLADHCGLRIVVRYYAIDSWDANEVGRVWVDGAIVWEDTRWYIGNDFAACLYDWKLAVNAIPAPWGGLRCYQDLSIIISHTAPSATIAFSATLSDVALDEGYSWTGLTVDALASCTKTSIALPADVVDARWSRTESLTGINVALGAIHGRFVDLAPLQKMWRLYGMAHCSVRVTFRYWAIDSWDAGEYARFFVDGTERWAKLRYINPGDYSACLNSWTNYGGSFPNPWNGSPNESCYFDVDITVPHTANTLTLKWTANLDSPGDDESWAVSTIAATLLPC